MAEQPRKRRGAIQNVLAFLSHTAWQGISGIFGILSLLVTIGLTIYVFVLTRNQQTAYMDYEIINQSVLADTADSRTTRMTYSISNDGPATGQDVTVIIDSF